MTDTIKTEYVRAALSAIEQLEDELNKRYDNWRLRLERESPGVWRCRWDFVAPDGSALGGGGESFSITL